MKKTILQFILVLNCSTSIISAQSLNWIWAKECGSNATLNNIDIDNAENLYGTGTFANSAVFDTIGLTPSSAAQFLIKMNNNGHVTNAVQAANSPGNAYSGTVSVAADDNGNCYATGIGILVKYNSNLDTVWRIIASYSAYNFAYGNYVATDNSANAYVAGSVYGDPTIGSYHLNYSNGAVFLAKVDSFGNIGWLKQTALNPINFVYANPQGIKVDGSGNIYLVGDFTNEGIFGTDTVMAVGSGYNVFIEKFDGGGNFKWVITGSSGSDTYFSNISIDKRGNLIVAGTFKSNLIFSNGGTISGSGSSQQPFIAKLAPDSSWVWGRTINDQLSITNYNATQDITVDNDNNIYWTGLLTNTVIFPPDTLQVQSGSGSCFVLKYDSAGNYQSSIESNPSFFSQGAGIRTFSNGDIFVAGDFVSNPSFGSSTLPTESNESSFIAKIGNSCAPLSISAGNNQSISSGQSVTLSANISSGTSPYTYSWSSSPTGFTSSLSSPQVSPTTTTTYYLTVTENGGCTATDSVKITVNGLSCDTSIHPVINQNNCTLAVQQYNGASYQWELNGQPISNSTSAFYAVAQSGFYTCSVTIGSCVYYSNNENISYSLGSCTTGIVQLNDLSSVTISPNPSSGQLAISFQSQADDNILLRIFTQLGQLIFNDNIMATSGKFTKEIHLENESAGIYIMQISMKNGVINKRIVVN